MATYLVNKSEFAKRAGVSPAAVTKACKSSLAPALVGSRVDLNHPSAAKYLRDKERARMPSPAAGVDPEYEKAIEWCRETGRWSARGIRAGLDLSESRSRRIMKMIKAAGLVPERPARRVKPPSAEPGPAPKPQPARVPSGQEARRITKQQEARRQLTETLETGRTLHQVPEDIEAFADMTLRELIQRFGTEAAFLDWLKATQTIEAINEKRIKNAERRGELVSRELVETGVIGVVNGAHLRLMSDGAKSITAGVISKHAAGFELAEIEAYVSDLVGSFIRPIKNKVKRTLRHAAGSHDSRA